MRLRVGLCYNLIDAFAMTWTAPSDLSIEWSTPEYITVLMDGLIRAGFEVIDIGDPLRLLDTAIRDKVDILFSIAEMKGYRYREILVPSVCEMLGLPYCFARPDAMLITADKHLSNLVVQRLGIDVPDWWVATSSEALKPPSLDFPLIVKPRAEGSSMGIFYESIVHDAAALQIQVQRIMTDYGQPALVQTFLPGQEITVAVIEDDNGVLALTPLEIFTEEEGNTQIFDIQAKKVFKTSGSVRPLKNDRLIAAIRTHAIRIFREIGCRHAARLDFRIWNDRIYFIEINGLTDFHPAGAFCMSGHFSGIPYEKLLYKITTNAWRNRTLENSLIQT